MREELLHYYERELTYLRRMGAEFAERYPKIAGRLLLEPSKCEDPHVERLLEAFAFLAARVHLRLDDDFPEVAESLLNAVYPHYTRPLPAMTVVEMRLEPDQAKLTSGVRIPRGTPLLARPSDGVQAAFRTCYDATVWPLAIAGTQWVPPDRLRPALRAGDAVGALRFELRGFGETAVGELAIDRLRLHLSGEGNVTFALYELLCNNVRQVIVREAGGAPGARSVTLPASAITPAGFAEDEGLLPYPGHSFQAHRLLQEYFAFPEKYLFVDLEGLAEARAAGLRGALEVVVLVGPFERADWRPMLEAGVDARTVRAGCTPVINLFDRTAEPILLSQRRREYRLVPDARRRLTTEVFSIDDVTAVSPGSRGVLRFEPFYALRHGMGGASGLYWTASRQPSGWRTDAGTDVWLSFVDLSGRAVYPEADAVTARVTCYNGDLPSRLPLGHERGDFTPERGGPVKYFGALTKPTRVVQPPLGRALLWRLVSHLSLGYLSLVDGGPEPLRELLRLYDFADSPSSRKQVESVLAVRGGPAFSRVRTPHGLAFARGRRVEVEIDEEQFAGGGVFLFASVLERVLGLSASLNSFTTLTARSTRRKTPLREWGPRSGWKPLL